MSVKRYKLQLQLKGVGVIINEENNEPRQATSQNYGFWSVAENNDFHPDIKSARDVEPKPEDYFLIPFRFISACIVGGESYKATRFPADVLKASMDKLLGVPVYTDHDTETVTNCIGYVESVNWSDGYTLEDGTVVPPGIEGNYAIDSKIAPGVGRNLLTGAINSNSVTVEFYWKPSHTLPENVSLWEVIGKYDSQGNMYCRVVDEIVGYLETSPVFRGADPFAKGIDSNNKVKRVDKANIFYSDDKKAGEDEKAFQISCTNGIGKLHLSKSNLSYQQDKNKPAPITTATMDKVLLSFIAKWVKNPNLKAEEVTPELVQSFTQAVEADINSRPQAEEFTRLQSVEKAARIALNIAEETAITDESFKNVKIVSLDSYTALETKAAKTDELTNEVTSLKAERDALKPDAETGKALTEELRTEAIRLHTAVNGGAPNEATLQLIKDAKNVEAVKGLIQSFGGKLATSEFKAYCKSCKSSDHVSFQSSTSTDNNAKKPMVALPMSKEEIDERRMRDTDL